MYIRTENTKQTPTISKNSVFFVQMNKWQPIGEQRMRKRVAKESEIEIERACNRRKR